jgi:hypothetical protein
LARGTKGSRWSIYQTPPPAPAPLTKLTKHRLLRFAVCVCVHKYQSISNKLDRAARCGTDQAPLLFTNSPGASARAPAPGARQGGARRLRLGSTNRRARRDELRRALTAPAVDSASSFCLDWWRCGPCWLLTGAGAGPRGHCRLAACPGDRVLRSPIRIRSRILGSNHFAPLSLVVHIGPGFGLSALPRRVATWRTNDLCIDCTASTPPHRPIEFFAYNYFDCRHRGSPCCLYARQSRPARSTTAVNLFHLRTTG